MTTDSLASAAVIVNPASRSAEAALDALRRAADQRGLELRITLTTAGHPGASQTRQAFDKGIRSFVAIGGDGTIRQVAGALGGTGAALGVMPAGAGNIFARNLGLRPDAHAPNAEVALAGSTRAADLGWARLDGDDREPFLSMIGCGRDAEVVAAVTSEAKRLDSWRAYAREGLRVLRAKPLPVTVDGIPQQHWSVLVGNAPRVPLGARVFPGTRLDSGDLEVLRTGAPSLLDWLGIAAFGMGLRRSAPSLNWRLAETVRLSFPTPRLVQIDGDVLPPASEVLVGVDAGALQVRVPQ